MDATCTIQDSIHVFSLVHKYVSRILGTYHMPPVIFLQILYIFLIYLRLLVILFLPENLSSKKSECPNDSSSKDDKYKLDRFVISCVWSVLVLYVYRLCITVDVGVIRKNGSVFHKDMRNSYISSFFTLKTVPTTFGPALDATAAPIWK